MPKFDAASAACFVFTRKEGLLSPIAHDLKLSVTNFSLDVDLKGRHVTARFDPRSLRVVGVIKKGELQEDLLKDEQKSEIETAIIEKVLHADKFPDIYFMGTELTPDETGFRVAGKLHLHGTQFPLTLGSHPEGEKQIVEVELHQPDFGIKPYSAMLGAIKIKPNIGIRVEMPIAS